MRAGTPVADEGIGFGIATGELDGAEVELASQHVITTVACVRTAERVWFGWILNRAATAADDPASPWDCSAHSWSRIPLRAFNSSIIPSHTGTISRIAVQKDGSLRTQKSSTDTPCCSTHVK